MLFMKLIDELVDMRGFVTEAAPLSVSCFLFYFVSFLLMFCFLLPVSAHSVLVTSSVAPV